MMRKSIIERVKASGAPLAISQVDLMREFVRLYRGEDRDGLQALYRAFQDWESKYVQEDPRETAQRVQGNMDSIAHVADNFLKYGDVDAAHLLTGLSRGIDDVGPVRTFCRSSIGYNHTKRN